MKNIILAQVNSAKAIVEKCEKANTILDKDSSYKELKNTLVVGEINTKLNNVVNSITSKNNTVTIVRDNNSVDLSVGATGGVQEITCFDGSIFIDNITPERPNITIENYPFVNYPKNQFFIGTGSFSKLTVMSDNLKVDTQDSFNFGKITIDNFDESSLLAYGTIELNFSSCFITTFSQENRYSFQVYNIYTMIRMWAEEILKRYGGGKVQNLYYTTAISSAISNFPVNWGFISKVNSNINFVRGTDIIFEFSNENAEASIAEQDMFSSSFKVSFMLEVRR